MSDQRDKPTTKQRMALIETLRRDGMAQSSFAAPAGYASGVEEIESRGVVVGCDSTEQTITVKISTRPSGVRISDTCSIKWKRHPLTHNAALCDSRENL